MGKTASDEYRLIPQEYRRPAPEWNRPAGIPLPAKAGRKADIFTEKPATPADTKQKRKERIKQKLKIYALSAMTAVTAVTGFSAESRWNLERAEGLLWEHPLAYYAESVEELEYYAENELWYTIFGTDAQGNACEFYGMFGKSTSGPTKQFRDAFTVNPVQNEEPDINFGFPCYSYSLTLDRSNGGTVFKWELTLLENERQIIAAWTEDGQIHTALIESDDLSDDPEQIKIVQCNYDIETDEHGNPAERVWVYGNGTDIVGVWESDPEHGQILVHATPEHSNDPTGSGPSYLLMFTHGDVAEAEIPPHFIEPKPQQSVRSSEFNGDWGIVAVEESVLGQQTVTGYAEPAWVYHIEAGNAQDGAPILTLNRRSAEAETEMIVTGNGMGEYKAFMDNGDAVSLEIQGDRLIIFREESAERSADGKTESVRIFYREEYKRIF